MPSIRALAASDAEPARALVRAALDGTPYLKRTFEQLDVALGGDDPECVGMLAQSAQGAVGVLLHGRVAGATRVEKVHVLIGDNAESLGFLLRALSATSDARMIISELPGAKAFATATAALAANGFTREGSVEGFFSEGTALELLVWRRAEVPG